MSARSPEVQEGKRALRARVRALAGAVGPDERAARSAALCARVRSLAEWQGARAVLAFMPHPPELDITPLLEEALAVGKASRKVLGLPRARLGAGTMEVARVENLAQDLESVERGLRQPTMSCGVLRLESLDLALVPGLAFDALGGRLGRGGGFYDRLLIDYALRAKPAHPLVIGVCMDEQVVDRVPGDDLDARVGMVVTPTRILRCGSA